jgi:asparagine synthase (glutamine-hydrolysing)
MSVQFGIWNMDRMPVDKDIIQSAGSMLSAYAPDKASQFCGNGVTLLHHALHTTTESHRENQPHRSRDGSVILWDGRLDNREELTRELRNLDSRSTDVEIVAASFELWGTNCFAKLFGDWALTIWNEKERVLILAKDIIGIRPLYYCVDKEIVRWSSILDPLVTLYGRQLQLNEEYIAGWLAMYPAADSTPYMEIRAVPPCSFVRLCAQGTSIQRYWDFDPDRRIIYRSDAEYEEHFRTVFKESVRRRLRSDRPICTELSGGMDSASITCIADVVAASNQEIPQIETLSFYDESEPNANELPLLSKVEEQRGRVGCHINVTGRELFKFEKSRPFEATPSRTLAQPNEASVQVEEFLKFNGTRVVISGIGGDEVMGGVPNPTSELQDLFVQRRFGEFAHKLKVWALNKRKPWLYLVADVVAGFLPSLLTPRHQKPSPWLTVSFVGAHRKSLYGFSERRATFGGLPSFQANLASLETLRRQLATKCLPTEPAHEKRYPMLDRTLLEFLFAIPREQMVRPGYRRSLMRRSLAGIVPPELLQNKRKIYASRGPRVAISNEWPQLFPLTEHMVADRLGILNEQSFRDALIAIRNSDRVPLVRLMRTVVLEAWLRNIEQHRIASALEIQSVVYRPATCVPGRSAASSN